ncbi:hypothetical protein PIB30_008949 [Stylosanthes scabra]|uniref:Uncharacterized protein n=1 Tax=Stylosanthes scabra TaxID=79078 RepID=A0ABU6S5D0_9FABA|nr:hypothetical protein [Stylosanthes scabra]
MNRNMNMNIHHQERSTFLPMLCSRPSIKDVSLPRWNNNPPSSSSSNEPLSPRIGCMGQVKRNNKIASSSLSHKLITTTTTTSSSSPVIIKYTKLKNIFIAPKNLINTPTTTRTTTTIRHHHHQRVVIGKGGSSSEGVTTKKGTRCSGYYEKNNLIGCSSPSSSSIGIVSIDEMDPPLPVVQIKKEKEKVGEDNKDSLWKRRKSGSLQSLQLQHHPRISLQPTTV